jgi:glucose/arabinose dehydrogenase
VLRSLAAAALLACALAACSGGGSSAAPFVNQQPPGSVGVGATPAPPTPPTPSPPTPSPVPTATPQPTATPVPAPPANASLHVPAGFIVSKIASVGGARELAALPNGDLIVGTSGTSVVIVPNAESPGAAGAPATFASINDAPVQGVAYGGGFVFAATQHGVYRIPYASGAQSGTPQKIASVRTGAVAPNSDGDVHSTSSVAVSGSVLYVGVGSSCNACAEADPTRATVQRMALDGSGMTTQAMRWRNAIALATDPASGTVWAGGAGQDSLSQGHPYEFMDAVSAHAAPADYGWPDCEENHVAYKAGANCANVVVPAIEFPAYSTLIGAAFYPAAQSGPYAFPAAWRGGLFVGVHGSWHAVNNVPVDPPHVAFVPFSGTSPARAVNWNDPTAQWNDFFTGFQNGASRIGRPTGVAVGAQGSLFVADDDAGAIYRIRPAGTAASSVRRR